MEKVNIMDIHDVIKEKDYIISKRDEEIIQKDILIMFQSQQIGQLLKENEVFSRRDYDFKIEKENEELKKEVAYFKKICEVIINKNEHLTYSGQNMTHFKGFPNE
jgi:hypothetical protein